MRTVFRILMLVSMTALFVGCRIFTIE